MRKNKKTPPSYYKIMPKEKIKDINLTKIYIRCRNKEGKLDNLNLKEAPPQEVMYWFLSKIYQTIGVKEGDIIEEEHIKAMVRLLEALGFVIYRLK